jgi:hypothetical protein
LASPCRRFTSPVSPSSDRIIRSGHAQIAYLHQPVIDLGLYALPHFRPEALRVGQHQAAVAGFGHNGLTQRVLAAFLYRSGQPQELHFTAREVVCYHIRDRWLTAGNGSGLIQNDRVQPAGPFQRFTGFEQDA